MKSESSFETVSGRITENPLIYDATFKMGMLIAKQKRPYQMS